MTSVPDFVALAAFGRVADLQSLLPFLPPRASAHGPDAARAADAIFQRATPDDVTWLERHRPSVSEWIPSHRPWMSLREADFGEPPLPASGSRTAVTLLASMHSSGFVREAAVRMLDTRDDGGELPYLLVRLNDWVPQVREAAEAAVRARLVPAYAERFVACLALAERLRDQRRGPHRELLRGIEDLLCTAAPGGLPDALRAPSARLRRAAARIAALTSDPALLMRAATSRDPVVATIGARAIATAWTGDALREALPPLRRGPSSVRFIALAAACDKLPRDAEPLLREALLDPSTSVRELARHRWGKLGLAEMSFSAFYRDQVSRATGPQLAVALRGLAETAEPADAPVFEPFLRDARAAVRSAAVLGLGRCNDPRYHPALASAMDDASIRVAAEARRWVRVRLGRAQVRQRARPAP